MNQKKTSTTRVYRGFTTTSPSPDGERKVYTKVHFDPKSKLHVRAQQSSASTPKPVSKSAGSRNQRPMRLGGFTQDYSDRSVRPRPTIPDIDPGVLRVIPICGVEWITTNMMALEFGDEIIIIDDGAGFKNVDTPGISCTIPDTTYLEMNKHKIKAMVITHGHLDHVNAIPYNIVELGMPPIYTREFAAHIIARRMQEFPHIPKLDIRIVDRDSGYITLSENFAVKFFSITHSIPDSTGVIIQTPFGGVVSTGDVRVENTDGIPVDHEYGQYEHFKNENILLATIDSTGIPKPGWSKSEMDVRKNIDSLIQSAKGRLFIATYASQVDRLISFSESAVRHGRYLVIDGRSMKSNLEIAKLMELSKFENTITIEESLKLPPEKLLYLVTGGQGEKNSVLDRVARGTHRHIKINASDTVILSSSVVAGNEHAVDGIKNALYKSGAHILTYTDNIVHASGHGCREELKWIHQQIPYTYFMPVHGAPWFLQLHAQMAQRELGVPSQNIIVPENGSVLEFYDNGTSMRVCKQKAVTANYIVDGAYVGPVRPAVLHDRLTLSENGIFVIVVTIDSATGELYKSPDIISRGCIFLQESKNFLSQTRNLVKKICNDHSGRTSEITTDELKKQIVSTVTKYIYQKTQKEPIVISVVTCV